MMKQTPSPVKRLWELTGTHRRAYMLSIILAILSVACGMIPYFAIAYIMLCLIDGVTALNTYALWCGVILLGFTLKLFFSTLSTTVSHTATFQTLKEIRIKIADKLSRVPILFYLQGSMTLVYCLLMCVASFLIFSELEAAGGKSFALRLIESSIDKVNAIDDTPVMDLSGKDIAPKDTTIELQNVGFSYGDHRILNHVNLTIPAKTTTAIVGPSGSGKTTLCSLITRFWDVDEGCIKLGGTDIREYKLDSLLSNISMVFQNVFLFADSIENNIKFGKPDATHEEVVRAAKSACCHDFIMALPNGYDTVIGESGATLSGGEKQRISIARAILKDTPIIILDEATSSVDPENEAELQQAIEKLTEDKTVIIIAHRLKTVRNAQQIVVIANGGIAQRGTHQELMTQPGIYADFVNIREKAVNWKISSSKIQQ